MDVLHFELFSELERDLQIVMRLRLVSNPQMLRTFRFLQNWFVLDVALVYWLLLFDLGWHGAEGHDLIRLLASMRRCSLDPLLIIDKNDRVLLT